MLYGAFLMQQLKSSSSKAAALIFHGYSPTCGISVVL
jgi:hypothetical protein